MPRCYSDGRPYYSLNAWLKDQFGQKIYKLALDGGMTCPNRDGTVGSGGCIFCSAGGSGDFAADARLSIREQIESQEEKLRTKFPAKHFVAYFQAYTNTYAPVDYLRKIFTEAITHPDIVALSIGTRPDCLPDDVLDLLSSLNEIKPVTIELGLQTIHEKTAAFIRRGYAFPVLKKQYRSSEAAVFPWSFTRSLGFPAKRRGYARYDPLSQSPGYPGHQASASSRSEGDRSGCLVRKPGLPVFTEEEYIDLVIRCIDELSPDITIHRLTGDGPKELLIAPLWSSRKRSVLNEIHRQLKLRGSWQGKFFQP